MTSDTNTAKSSRSRHVATIHLPSITRVHRNPAIDEVLERIDVAGAAVEWEFDWELIVAEKELKISTGV